MADGYYISCLSNMCYINASALWPLMKVTYKRGLYRGCPRYGVGQASGSSSRVFHQDGLFDANDALEVAELLDRYLI